jgi:hypothetical protein
MSKKADFPGSPDPLPFPKSTIENIVTANVTLGPMTLAAVRVVFSFDQEDPDVIPSIAAH